MLKKFTSLMPVWVVVAGVAGFFYPPVLTAFKPWLEWMFFGTMLGIGCAMNLSDFRPLVTRPQVILLGILAQFLIMPAAGFLIGKALHLPAELLLGMVLVGAVPGAMASNVVAYLAKTDVAYSIALTSTATLLAPVLTPLLTYLYMHTIIQIQFWGIFLSILKIVILPLLIGLTLKYFFKETIVRFHDLFPALSTVCIALICGMVVALNQATISALSLAVFLGVFLHNLAGYGGGYGAGKIYRFDRRRCRTLAVEVGMQNAGLGAVLAVKHFSPETAIMPAVFATWCVITASCLARYWNGRSRNGES
jgi:BASS family bile acid:Na+ symporter